MAIDETPQNPTLSNASFDQPANHKNGWRRIAFYLLLLVLLCGIVWRIWNSQQAAKKLAADQASAMLGKPVPVQITTVEQRPMPVFDSALGTVTPYMSVTVKARVSGELLPAKFTEGQNVRQGETILRIDPKPYKASLDQAKGTLQHDQALLKNAQAEYRRYKALYEAGVTSKETLDADESTQGQYLGAIAADRAAVDSAQLQLNWCSIQSPINGKIGLRLVDPGNIITANTTNLVIINQIQPIAVYFTLPENLLPKVLQRLRTDKRIPVEAWDRGDAQKIAVGYLLTSDNQIDTTTGTAKLKAVFDNKDLSLFPNQFVNIHLILENRPNALVIPTAAIQSGVQGSFVWGIETNAKGATVAKMLPVKVALSEGQLTILDGGVKVGDQVVIDGADRLRAGAPVQISHSHAAQPAAPTANGLFTTPGATPAAQTTTRPNGSTHNAQPKKERQ